MGNGRSGVCMCGGEQRTACRGRSLRALGGASPSPPFHPPVSAVVRTSRRRKQRQRQPKREEASLRGPSSSAGLQPTFLAMEHPTLASGDPSETARLVGSQSGRSSSSLRLKSLFAGSQDVFPNLPSENGHANISMVGLKMEPCVVPHCHLMPCSTTQSQQKRQAQRKLSIACLVCFLFMVGEVIGGYLAHSLAIMTDAAHLLTDMGSMGVSLFSLWVSTRPATKTMSFGWHRSETLGALASVFSIWIVTGVLVYLASARIISNDYEIEASVMLGTSACAVGVNIIMAYLLHQSGSAHSHGFSTRGYEQIEDSPRGPSIPTHDNTSVRAAFVHVVGDLLQSIGVFVAATVIYFKPQCKIADPVSTFLFSVFVLGSTLTILRDVFRVLMEGTPRGVEFQAVKETLLSVKGVKQVHNLHLWALTLSHHVVAVHLAVESDADMEVVLQEATALLQSKFGFFSCTIQVEHYLDDMVTCHQCQDPQD